MWLPSSSSSLPLSLLHPFVPSGYSRGRWTSTCHLHDWTNHEVHTKDFVQFRCLDSWSSGASRPVDRRRVRGVLHGGATSNTRQTSKSPRSAPRTNNRSPYFLSWEALNTLTVSSVSGPGLSRTPAAPDRSASGSRVKGQGSGQGRDSRHVSTGETVVFLSPVYPGCWCYIQILASSCHHHR